MVSKDCQGTANEAKERHWRGGGEKEQFKEECCRKERDQEEIRYI